MSEIDSILSIVVLLLLSQHIAFILSRVLKRYDIADIFWAVGFILVAGQIAIRLNLQQPRALLMAALTILWGLRLATYLFVRARGTPEDRRYREWRAVWGQNEFVRSYLQVFLLQGVILFLVASPLWLVSQTQFAGWVLTDFVGLILWIFGFVFESIADEQMRRFRLTKKSGEVLSTGLWSLSRHPNYFGELCVWWGIYAIAIGAEPLGVWAFGGPALLTFLILKVSGITMIEQARTHNATYQDYQSKTPCLVPRLFKWRQS